MPRRRYAADATPRALRAATSAIVWGGPSWESRVRASAVNTFVMIDVEEEYSWFGVVELQR